MTNDEVDINDVNAVRLLSVATVSAVSGIPVEEIIRFLRGRRATVSVTDACVDSSRPNDDDHQDDQDVELRCQRLVELRRLTPQQLVLVYEHFKHLMPRHEKNDPEPTLTEKIERVLDVVCSTQTCIPSWCDVRSYVAICKELATRPEEYLNRLFRFWCGGAPYPGGSQIDSIAIILMNELRFLQRVEVSTLIDLACHVADDERSHDLTDHINRMIRGDRHDPVALQQMIAYTGFSQNICFADLQQFARMNGVALNARGLSVQEDLNRLYRLAGHDAQSWDISTPSGVVNRVKNRMGYVQSLLDLQPRIDSLQFRVFCVLRTDTHLTVHDVFKRVRFSGTDDERHDRRFVKFKGRQVELTNVMIADVRACLRDLVNCGAVDHTKGRYIIR